MDTQVLDIIKIAVAGLIGAVITPFVAQLLIPLSRRRFGLDSTPSVATIPSSGTAPSEVVTMPVSESTTSVSKPTRPSSKYRRISLLAGVGLVFFGLVAYFLVKSTFLSPCPFLASTSVLITSPAEGSNVSPLTIVQGTACHIPSDKGLWLFVVAGGAIGYYPQNGPIDVASDGTWSGNTFIGSPKEDVGKEFVLYTALADHEGGTTLQQYINSGRASGKFPPIPLPMGVQLISQVHVVRK